MKQWSGRDAVRRGMPFAATLAAFALCAVFILWYNAEHPMTFKMYSADSIAYEKAVVTAVLEEELVPADGMPGRMLGDQTIRVRMRDGAMKGQEIELRNNLSTDHNIRVRVGQKVIVKADRPPEIPAFYTLYNYDRTAGLWLAGGIFLLFMVAVGRMKGLRSVLGIGISLFFICGLLLPTIYHGLSPVLMALVTVVAVAAFSFLLLDGFSRKTLTALTATVLGVLLSAGFYYLLSAILSLSGYSIDGAETLILVSRQTGLQLRQVLFVGVLISSIGAVMDVTVSVASPLYEMKRLQPELAGAQWFRSGLAIGQDMVGTMSQTLILAFVGSAISSLLVLVSYGTGMEQFLSSDYIAIEVLQGITGSLAVIAAVPVTAGLCVLLGRLLPEKKGT